MTHTAPIRRRPDGSIDTAHYMAEGRRCRSRAAQDLLPASRTAARRGLPILGVLAAVLFGTQPT